MIIHDEPQLPYAEYEAVLASIDPLFRTLSGLGSNRPRHTRLIIYALIDFLDRDDQLIALECLAAHARRQHH